MIPVIDFESETVLEEIREAYTTVGFAVFTNTLSTYDNVVMGIWFEDMKKFIKRVLRFQRKKSMRTKQ